MEETNKLSLGYTTREALQKLRYDINSVISDDVYNYKFRWSVVQEIISFSSEKVLLSGVAYTITFLYIISLIFTYFMGHSVQAHYSLLLEALFLTVVLSVNFTIAFNERRIFNNEIPYRVRKVLDTLDEAIESSVWKENHYPHLCAPFSPCVTLQWTYRDGAIVNLPWALLVEGDVIVLRPGQEVPGHCQCLQSDEYELYFGQTYQPKSQSKDNFSVPHVRSPHQNKAFRMCETPYLKNLKIALKQATKRPTTVFEKQRYLCTVKILEGIVLPVLIVLVVVTLLIRHVYHLPGVTHWTELYLLQTIASTLPLVQIIFPIAWVMLNCYGLARFKLVSEVRQKYVRPKSHSISEDATDPLLQAISESNLNKDDLKTLWRTFINILTGKEDMITRTANIVHVLGSLTALSCVDKKGILSWPNPTAEKVFFLRQSNTKGPTSLKSSKTSLDSNEEHSEVHEQNDGKQNEPSTVAEVLDLTHDQNAPFCVEFDDQRWREHLSLLKPLGLAALLNTCSSEPRHTYAQFCAHIMCEAQLSEDLVPVTNRRCLCELAKQIGFSDAVVNKYKVEDCLAVFRHLQAETIRRETRFVKSLQLRTRVKVPLPHMLSVLVSEYKGRRQMFTQGTADIILDSCVDYWNGRDLTPLSAADRKKIIDFYQRNSLTAYCTAFSYKPLNRGISPNVSRLYLELPTDNRSYAPLSHQWNEDPPMYFHSTDSLLFNEVTEEDVVDADGYFDMMCDQVFIGMVTMQYQAQSDMVELIERLERACIRFVHFSKENELRSRVFSEKMGLESGWNCHISLMSDDTNSDDVIGGGSPVSVETGHAPRAPTRPSTTTNTFNATTHTNLSLDSRNLSTSAPGAINIEHNTVKFENDIKPRHSSITPTHRKSVDAAEGGVPCPESPGDACRSLSCLTDSTDHSAPVNFDMTNRAKLPRGISNIRPHIEQVDNVPLLVSLFTDCSARSVQLMVALMQDYREVVAVAGSAANNHNIHIFMTADISIAVEPLYPVICQKMPPYQIPEKCVGPVDLARALNSVPCSLSLRRDADLSLFALITMSRHFTMSLWNCTQFWLCASVYIALIQVVSLMCFLPGCVCVCGSLWLCGVAALTGGALLHSPPHPALMTRAHLTHHAPLNAQMVLFTFWCYACKFLPSLICIVTLYGLTLRSFCHQISEVTNATSCWIVYPVNTGPYSEIHDLTKKSFHGWGDDFYDGLYLAQHITLALIIVHLIVISVSFVHRHSSIWERGVWTNKVWLIVVILMLPLQCIYSVSLTSTKYGYCERWDMCSYQYYVPWSLVLGYVISPALVFGLNEFIKWQEIKADERNQRRARLDFGTKLGMNSPF